MAEAARERAPLKREPWTSRPPRAYSSARVKPRPTVWGIADAFLGVALLLGVLIAGNVDRMPRGVEEFLAVRLSLKNILLLTAFGLAWPGVLWACGLYDPTRLREGRGEWPRLIMASAVACLLAMVFPLTSRSGAARPIHALLFAVLVAPSAAAMRAGARTVRRLTRSRAERNAVIVGSGPRACASYLELCRTQQARYHILGFIDDAAGSPPASAFMQSLGALNDLELVLTQYVVDEVRITLPLKSRYDAFERAIATCERVGVEFSYPSDAFQHALTRPRLSNAEGRSTVTATPAPDDEDLALKRAFDLAVASAMLILLSLPMVLIAVAVKLTSRGPVLFAQERFGKNKRLFRMYKFRSMHLDAEETLRGDPTLYAEYARNNFKLPDHKDPRVTLVGPFLRKTSLDELPQLWNVLCGDMSIVGPRPIVPAEVGQYGASASLLLALKPGLTSMWVVEGRSSVGYPRRADLELKYIRDWSLLRDLWIIVRTIPAVFRGRGAH